MSARDPRPLGWWLLPLFLGASVITAVAAVVVAVERAPPRRPTRPPSARPVVLAAPAESIAGEAEVFRTDPAMMAIAPATPRDREAHPRTLATFRYLRAYPGAPPRIPHELTPEEFREGACKTCHERGGYSRRFAAYVPLTPHPDARACLQCHVGDDALTAIPLESRDPNRRCRQCHAAGGRPRSDFLAPLGWRTPTWPRLPPGGSGLEPPITPHQLASRGNCVACHAGPAAVAEIRTTHPEWADCRQCHITSDPDAGVFSRTAPDGGDRTGGSP